jgi:hypothetical protein
LFKALAGVSIRDRGPHWPAAACDRQRGNARVDAARGRGGLSPRCGALDRGAHFVAELERLAIRARLAPRLRMYPNGGAAMRELAAASEPTAIGCTQATEIRDPIVERR